MKGVLGTSPAQSKVTTCRDAAINCLVTYEINKAQNKSGSIQPESSECGGRAAQLLLAIADLKSLDQTVVHQLFFSPLLGQIPVENIVPYLLSCDTPSSTGSPPGSALPLRMERVGSRQNAEDQQGDEVGGVGEESMDVDDEERHISVQGMFFCC